MRHAHRSAIALLGVLVVSGSCSSEEPPEAPAAPQELTPGPLTAGSYTRAGFTPSVVLVLDDGWSTGTLTDGFFDVQQEQGTPDVIAVQFGIVLGIFGDDGVMLPPTTAADAIASLKRNPGLVVFGESESRLGGLVGLTLEVENQGSRTTSVMKVQPGVLGFDPGRRLWISLFDTPDGLLAVMVGGSVAQWERALAEAEPVLESVVIGGA